MVRLPYVRWNGSPQRRWSRKYRQHRRPDLIWNNPEGGALQWSFFPQNAVIDTAGDIRWYMFANPIFDLNDIYKSGVMMGFKQNDDGTLTWGFGQRYVKYDIMGREVFNRRLPLRFNDYSHSMDDAQNGHYFLRVASSNYLRPDGKHVRTVRDVIAEVDKNGVVVDEWRLADILDPYRDNVLKVLDQGAVCLNGPVFEGASRPLLLPLYGQCAMLPYELR